MKKKVFFSILICFIITALIVGTIIFCSRYNKVHLYVPPITDVIDLATAYVNSYFESHSWPYIDYRFFEKENMYIGEGIPIYQLSYNDTHMVFYPLFEKTTYKYGESLYAFLKVTIDENNQIKKHAFSFLEAGQLISIIDIRDPIALFYHDNYYYCLIEKGKYNTSERWDSIGTEILNDDSMRCILDTPPEALQAMPKSVLSPTVQLPLTE